MSLNINKKIKKFKKTVDTITISMYYISCLRERAKMNAEVSELADEQD